jgi:hypothetical protein
MRVVLEDYGHYATGRKPRTGEDAVLILDEFSALASGVDSAINLAERVRDVGVQVIVAAQSVEGLGNQHQAPRLLASCAGGVVVHQCPDPERLLALAGTVRDVEHNWEVDRRGPRGVAKARSATALGSTLSWSAPPSRVRPGWSRPATRCTCGSCRRPRWHLRPSRRLPCCRSASATPSP